MLTAAHLVLATMLLRVGLKHQVWKEEQRGTGGQKSWAKAHWNTKPTKARTLV